MLRTQPLTGEECRRSCRTSLSWGCWRRMNHTGKLSSSLSPTKLSPANIVSLQTFQSEKLNFLDTLTVFLRKSHLLYQTWSILVLTTLRGAKHTWTGLIIFPSFTLCLTWLVSCWTMLKWISFTNILNKEEEQKLEVSGKISRTIWIIAILQYIFF